MQAQHDKIKRKTLLAPSLAITGGNDQLNLHAPPKQMNDEHQSRHRPFGTNLGNTVDLGAVVGGMEANGVVNSSLKRTIDFPLNWDWHFADSENADC